MFIPQELKAHLKAFLAWKKGHGENVSGDAPASIGQRGPLTRNGVWRVVKGLMAAVGLYPRYATHSCRHSYATHLYRASGGVLEVVQEQLGHASIKTTTIYAKVPRKTRLGPRMPWRTPTEARNRTVKAVRVGAAGGP